MKISADVNDFCARIGHRFKQPELIVQALTHGSFSSPTRRDNQRLEFLGDRVLGLTMADALLVKDETAEEGVLAPRFNALVRKEACADVARQIDLGRVLKLGKSEMASGGRRKEALLGDAMEAVIAAVYLDAGFEAARDMVLRLWGPRIDNVETDARDAKTALQEWAQAQGQTVPRYEIVKRTGPDHAPVFTISVTLDSGATAQAKAGSKRQAEQEAAAALLEKVAS